MYRQGCNLFMIPGMNYQVAQPIMVRFQPSQVIGGGSESQQGKPNVFSNIVFHVCRMGAPKIAKVPYKSLNYGLW